MNWDPGKPRLIWIGKRKREGLNKFLCLCSLQDQGSLTKTSYSGYIGMQLLKKTQWQISHPEVMLAVHKQDVLLFRFEIKTQPVLRIVGQRFPLGDLIIPPCVPCAGHWQCVVVLWWSRYRDIPLGSHMTPGLWFRFPTDPVNLCATKMILWAWEKKQHKKHKFSRQHAGRIHCCRKKKSPTYHSLPLEK